MAGSLNEAKIIGHLGQDPEIRYTQGGAAVCNFSVATTNRFKSGEEWKEEVEWHKVVCWNKLAENCAEYLAKGRQVFVDGRLHTNKWEDKDGNTRYTTEIVANNVIFLSSGERGGGGGGRRQERPQERQQQRQQSAPTDNGYDPPPPDESDVPF